MNFTLTITGTPTPLPDAEALKAALTQGAGVIVVNALGDVGMVDDVYTGRQFPYEVIGPDGSYYVSGIGEAITLDGEMCPELNLVAAFPPGTPVKTKVASIAITVDGPSLPAQGGSS